LLDDEAFITEMTHMMVVVEVPEVMEVEAETTDLAAAVVVAVGTVTSKKKKVPRKSQTMHRQASLVLRQL
jgi:hypothetical protein